MTQSKIDPARYGFPPGLSQPALRALLAADITSLEQVAAAGRKKLLKLHGLGPKAIPMLREALAESGLAFADEPSE